MSTTADLDRKCRALVVRMEGIEPSPSGWKPGALPIELHPRGAIDGIRTHGLLLDRELL